MLAALNHPSIAAIYGLEEREGKQVMELVKGDTLAERLRKGPLEVKEALRIAIQMAEALEMAHGAEKLSAGRGRCFRFCLPFKIR